MDEAWAREFQSELGEERISNSSNFGFRDRKRAIGKNFPNRKASLIPMRWKIECPPEIETRG